MVKIEDVGSNKEAACWIERPGIYLDHWAMRLFAEDTARRERFREVLKTKGTVLISIMNIREIADNTGQSATNLRAFLDAIGPRWFPISVNARRIAEREDSYKVGDNPPMLGDAIVRDDKFRQRLEGNDVSLAGLVDLTRAEDGMELIAAARKDEDLVICGMQYWRNECATNKKILKEKWPKVRFDVAKPMRSIYNYIMRLCITDSFTFDDNHVRDLLHTTVPMAYADLVLLDPHWAGQANKVRKQLGLSEERPRLYTKATVDDFLADFEGWSQTG
jgi:hypothetical protein